MCRVEWATIMKGKGKGKRKWYTILHSIFKFIFSTHVHFYIQHGMPTYLSCFLLIANP